MSFTSRDLMIDVLPARIPFAAAGTEEEEDDLKCSPATAGDPPPSGIWRVQDLATLRHQLREALVLE